MRGGQKANRSNKRKREWGTGDLNGRDSELFKQLPRPGGVAGRLDTTKELPKVKTKRLKRRVTKG